MRPSGLLCWLALVAALALPAAAHAVTVTLEPADTTVSTGATVQLRVVASPFANLKGYELVHSFDSGRLDMVSVLPGDVLTGTGREYADFAIPDAVAPVDSTWLDAAMLDGTATAPGVIAYIVFTASHTGDALVRCEHVEFRDSVNAVTLPDCAGAVIHISGPVPARRTSWGSLKSVYR
jgi:hypothetical protein